MREHLVRVLADVNISVTLVRALLALGVNVERTTEHLPATATDVEIAALSVRLGAVLLTRDQDFATLLAMSGESAPSIINLRHRGTDARQLAPLLAEVVASRGDELSKGAIISMDERGVRVHRLPIGSAS
jgi:predicted nuclease of predicted toxin-antitoxin system